METVELGPSSAAVPREVPSTASPRWTLVAASFGLGMALLDVTAGNVAVPSIQRDFGTGIAVGDVTQDGIVDVFVGAPETDVETLRDRKGRIYVFPGNPKDTAQCDLTYFFDNPS